jgi:D-3-phosphoglycerate dehydrogenase
MLTILYSAPYMIPLLPRYRPMLEGFGLQLVVPEVHEHLGEKELLTYAGQFDGTICGDDHYTPRVLQACSPRLKVISKWAQASIQWIGSSPKACIQVRNTIMPSPYLWRIPSSAYADIRQAVPMTWR